jgi:hypothetical protein
MIPAAAAAAIATPKDAQGYCEPASSADSSIPVVSPGSGTFKTAERNPRDHFSSVCSKRP